MNRLLASVITVCLTVSVACANSDLVSTYFDQCALSIQKAWFPPAGTEVHRGVVCYVLNKDGKVSDIKVQQSLKNKTADLSMILAVKNVSPFPAPPTEIKYPRRLRAIFDVAHFPPGKPCKVEFAAK